ncbi:N-acetylmannosamine kinase [Klebsiella pneumoniae]|uniref:N-acetylmannosamine kinase n=1 Tax=Klebsiella pneumoniae TaxID=573 RepID=A0A2X1QG18_KLEPN|nr:N-acetylmannosamine kinase [Klebsiella pneumoniae]
MKIAAFDIGGTALKMGVMARDGRLLETARQSINDSDGDRILQANAVVAGGPSVV